MNQTFEVFYLTNTLMNCSDNIVVATGRCALDYTCIPDCSKAFWNLTDCLNPCMEVTLPPTDSPTEVPTDTPTESPTDPPTALPITIYNNTSSDINTDTNFVVPVIIKNSSVVINEVKLNFTEGLTLNQSSLSLNQNSYIIVTGNLNISNSKLDFNISNTSDRASPIIQVVGCLNLKNTTVNVYLNKPTTKNITIIQSNCELDSSVLSSITIHQPSNCESSAPVNRKSGLFYYIEISSVLCITVGSANQHSILSIIWLIFIYIIHIFNN
eukprot:TRINITY_DN3396_c0_g1_i2.p1 TRINITY_DN3396_c0_g1~~TRINITY_DN3396_c0_g1_i2.p1  ORF type:complete len:269 (-),score=27.13 TRINITY_DN3396_c0_g1_i2:60-866(-)